MADKRASLRLGALVGCLAVGWPLCDAGAGMQPLAVSDNGRFLQYRDGEPFFWLGDTAWLLFHKLSREEAERYLQDRADKGFTVIQAMVIHHLPQENVYGDPAFADENPARPVTTPGDSPRDPEAYDYWDHVDYVVETAAAKGLYMAMVPVWGGVAKSKAKAGDTAWAAPYAAWLAERYGDRPNVIWLNGGDVRGDDAPEVWKQIGRTLGQRAPRQLVTFHPFGRTQSSTWFHDASWLDFNMFQSGHRRYDQRRDTDDPATWKGEDNWRYVAEDYARTPVKPTVDGEPSYEGIPQGLHDPNEPYWTAADARRYAYWSVFAGAFGHTYGNSAVMQMHRPADGEGAYGVRNFWYEAIDDPGAGQMRHLKDLMLARPFFERVPDPSLVAGPNGPRYGYVAATRGKNYALFYAYTGRAFEVAMGKLEPETVAASWHDPRTGASAFIGRFETVGTRRFDPPGEEKPGNDWVLALDGDGATPIP